MRKFIIITGALVALAVPTVASASQPANPGGFGKERAANLLTFVLHDRSVRRTGATWRSPAPVTTARSTTTWKADNGYLPVESSLATP